MSLPKQSALVLSGGGARGAYQVGVLQGIAEMGFLRPGEFPLVVGASAGAINGSTMAAFSDAPHEGLALLVKMWGEIRAHDVFRTDLWSLGKIALRWMRDLSLGGLLGGVGPKALLDTSPVIKLLEQLPFERIQRCLDEGSLKALAVLTTDYHSSKGVLFLQGAAHSQIWSRVHMHVERAVLTAKHLRASSAIPFFFPSVEVNGRHLGDGCIRNMAPLEPAIQLGATHILAIGVREVIPPEYPQSKKPPTIATVAGVLLDAVLLDSIAIDAEHCQRINRSLKDNPSEGGFRHVEVVQILPSRPIGALVSEMEYLIPYPIRYLLHGLGRGEAAQELSSYLIFHPKFCKRLMELGYSDAWAQKDRLAAFFETTARV